MSTSNERVIYDPYDCYYCDSSDILVFSYGVNDSFEVEITEGFIGESESYAADETQFSQEVYQIIDRWSRYK